MKQSKNKKIILNINPQPIINILIKDLITKETFKTIPCDNRQQAEMLMLHIGFDKKKFFSEIEEK
jgi:hypothetical protein